MATGRYDAAVVLPPETPSGDRDARALVRLACWISFLFSLIVLVAIVVMRQINVDPWFADLGPWAYAIPLGVASTGVAQTLTSFATRVRAYSRVARIAPLSRVVLAGIQVSLGLLKVGRSGLIFAAVVAPFVGMSVLIRVARSARRSADAHGQKASPSRLHDVARKFSDFPKVNLWFSLLNALAWNVQLLILGAFYTASDVGQYSLSYALLSLPASLVIGSVSQVFLRELSSRAESSTEARALAKRTLNGLVTISAIPFAVLAIGAPYIFRIAFGPQWTGAGEIARAMLPLVWCRFISTTLSVTPLVYRRQGLLLIWQVVTLALTFAAYAGGAYLGWSVVAATWLASGLVGPLYLAMVPLSFRIIRSGPPPQISGGAPVSTPVDDPDDH